MNRLAALLLVGVVALAMTACTGSSSGGGAGYGGGIGAGPASPSVAPSAASSAGSDGYTKGDYSYGGGATASPAGSLEAGTVLLSGFAFQPATLSVPAGTSLTFKNADATAHTVTNGENGVAIASPAFDQRLAPGSSTTVAFPAAGEVRVTCTIHHSMNLTVTVTP
jgi:plastocyanin